MTLTTGFFKIHRGILKYFEKPYTENEAWIWMISQAEYDGDNRGKVKGSMRQLGETWGKDKKTVYRWLKKWSTEQKPRISCEYAPCNVTSLHNKNATGGATGGATATTTITLLNYDKYQGKTSQHDTAPATGGATESGTLLKKEERKRKKKSIPLPPKDVEVIKAKLEKVDLPNLRQKFKTKDVNGRWEEFYETCVTGTAKKPWPNPYDYVDFSKGFCNWLRKSPDVDPKKKSWRDHERRGI